MFTNNNNSLVHLFICSIQHSIWNVLVITIKNMKLAMHLVMYGVAFVSKIKIDLLGKNRLENAQSAESI